MIFSTFSDVLLIVLCLGVLVQTTRMILALQAFRKSDIGQTVVALDHAAGRAGSVLAELKQMLATEATAHHRSLCSAEALRDELSVMVGVGNSVAERIMEAAAIVAPASQNADAPGKTEKVKLPAKVRKSRSKSSASPEKAASRSGPQRQAARRTPPVKPVNGEAVHLSTGLH